MNTISFNHVVPRVFSERDDLHSEIWENNVFFEKNQLYLVQADSGKGKSTFCSYILGYRHDFTGKILFDGTDIGDLKVKQWIDIRMNKISQLFQDLRLFPELTAMENILIKNNLTNFKRQDQIEEWFEMLGISDKKDAKVGQMSFGQQQRVALMRSLVQPFDFLLADEPISHLDDGNSRIMADIMMREAKSQGAGLIVTSIGKHMDLPYDKSYNL